MDISDIEISFGEIGGFDDKRVHDPVPISPYKDFLIGYDNAESLVDKITLGKHSAFFSFIPGNFVFGDFIEAFVVKNNLHIKKMQISTLSMSYDNIHNIKNIMHGGFVDDLYLIISDYFYSHERGGLIKDVYELLDTEKSNFQLAVARIHAKVCIFETYDGMKYTIDGSANLRSSDNIEQFSIQENESLYDTINAFYSGICDKYKTINKSLKHSDIWQKEEDGAVKEGQEPRKGTRKGKRVKFNQNF